MSESKAVTEAQEKADLYEIRIKGHLDKRWAHWFEGLSVTLATNGETLLSGPVVDQAALHGVLRNVRDLGMNLISVNQISGNQIDTSEVKIPHGDE